MTLLTTTRCHSVRSPEIRIQFAENILRGDAVVFLRGLEETVLGGSRYRGGESLQVGWQMTRFCELAPDLLGLCAPDMKSFPIHYHEDITLVLAHLRLQKDVADSFGFEAAFPSMFEAAVTCNRLGRSNSLVMERLHPEGAASGWIILCQEADHDHEDEINLIRESLYAVALKVPDVVEYLALPPEIYLDLRDTGPSGFFFRGKKIQPTSASYLGVREPRK